MYNTNITAAVVVTIMTVSNLLSPSHFPIHIAKLLLPYIRVSACIYTHMSYKYNIDQKCKQETILWRSPSNLWRVMHYTHIYSKSYINVCCVYVCIQMVSVQLMRGNSTLLWTCTSYLHGQKKWLIHLARFNLFFKVTGAKNKLNYSPNCNLNGRLSL